jgi:hypothetical protein
LNYWYSCLKLVSTIIQTLAASFASTIQNSSPYHHTHFKYANKRTTSLNLFIWCHYTNQSHVIKSIFIYYYNIMESFRLYAKALVVYILLWLLLLLTTHCNTKPPEYSTAKHAPPPSQLI